MIRNRTLSEQNWMSVCLGMWIKFVVSILHSKITIILFPLMLTRDLHLVGLAVVD